MTGRRRIRMWAATLLLVIGVMLVASAEAGPGWFGVVCLLFVPALIIDAGGGVG